MLTPARSLKKRVSATVRRAQQKYVVEKFNFIYYHGTGGAIPFTTTSWLGVDALKCPADMWIYQEILYKTRPDVVVECGVRFGGSTLYLAHLFDLMGGGQVIGCDITLENVHEKVRAHPRITLLEGSSIDEAMVADVTRRCEGKRTMVILDSDHSEKHVSNELRAYSPLVTQGCYLIVEDTNVNGHPAEPKHGPGPYEAVQKFLPTTRDFVVDRDCERLLVTFNPSGYLLRTH
ncbi:MAG TPA: CmcI family methyltransferase [Polyangiaceae bacterium]|jgi:cephalosporin hydroxylase|nr:CmcI family methyltransferase [Polyangiaceae bacterium]